MGNSQSTNPSADGTKHVFSSSTPINFSPDLLSSLESTPETNSSRQKNLELHIQQRVAEELEKIRTNQENLLEAARKRIAEETQKAEASAAAAAPSKTEKAKETGKDLAEKGANLLDVPSLPSLPSPSSLLPQSLGGKDPAEEERKSQSSKKVADEIEKLKTQLAQRKVLKELPKDVEKARGDVVSCLRVNDRRPLDCWKEVEVFKLAVKRLEDDFVSRVL
jgi:altered-inheritance-of-mitochondria protein 13